MTTSFNQKIRENFNQFAKGDKLNRENIDVAFGSLQLHPRLGEIDQILSAASQSNPRFSNDYLTYSEFALVTMEIIQQKRNEKATNLIAAPDTETTAVMNEYDVFLGGSCNPTTWRLDTAAPYLKKEGISFYNPQVDDWYPELIEIEENAKKSSNIKLFVFDNQTRALASLVETAFMASVGWRLIVVLHYLPESREVVIGGEILSKQEVKDLNRGRSFLCEILEKMGVPIFYNLEEALKCTSDVIHGRVTYERLLIERKRTGYQYGTWLIELREIFNKHYLLSQKRMSSTSASSDSSPLEESPSPTPDGTTLKPHTTASALLEFLQIQTLPSTTKDGLRYLDLVNCNVTFDMFCLLTAEAIFQNSNSLWTWGASLLSSFFNYTGSLLKQITETETRENTGTQQPSYDVFLGGSCGNTSWRQDIAIPILEASNATYYNPQITPDKWSIRKIPEENLAKETSKSVLFVISKDSPSIASITEAAFLMGKRGNLYLVIEDLENTDSQMSYTMTRLSEKDNRRARSYLRETAKLHNIPIFPTIQEAISALLVK